MKHFDEFAIEISELVQMAFCGDHLIRKRVKKILTLEFLIRMGARRKKAEMGLESFAAIFGISI